SLDEPKRRLTTAPSMAEFLNYAGCLPGTPLKRLENVEGWARKLFARAINPRQNSGHWRTSLNEKGRLGGFVRYSRKISHRARQGRCKVRLPLLRQSGESPDFRPLRRNNTRLHRGSLYGKPGQQR